MAASGWQEKLAWPKLVVFMVVVFLLMTMVNSLVAKKGAFDLPANNHPNDRPAGDVKVNTWCPLPEPTAAQDGLAGSAEFGGDTQLLQKQVDHLSAVVNVPTISYDDNLDVDEDPRWQAFLNLHETLKTQFPRVHEKMDLEKVNSYGLLYTLPGSSQTLKPIVIMAHQDVVPVPDPTRWTHPPFEAYFDGQWLWGRGSVDCKSTLVGILSAMERLLEQDFKNNRTIILSFGFDEETGGFRGAKHLAARLKEKHGENSMAIIVDEGGSGIRKVDDVGYALPATVEKGFLDIVLTLNTPGGHSSAPPPHSGIGIMSRFIAAVEDNPFAPHLDEHDPLRDELKCEVEHSPKSAEPWLKEALEKGEDFAERIVESRGDKIRWSIQTSQVVDIINGGIKDNQLPETVEAVINYRIVPSTKVDNILKSVADVLVPIANNFTIAVEGPGYSQIDRGSGLLNITSKNILPPSPLSPTGPDVGVWNVFAGSIRQVFENTGEKLSAKRIIPVGTLMKGNTDTAHYWQLSKNIYRFSPIWEGTLKGVHTVDERIDMHAHMGALRFYYELIRNMDGYTGE